MERYDTAFLTRLLVCLHELAEEELGMLRGRRCDCICLVEGMIQSHHVDEQFIQFMLHFAPAVKQRLYRCTPES